MLLANAVYEGGYWNTTGIARHVTANGILGEMQARAIDVLAHGSTGRGNDQVRFQLVANMLSPAVKVYAPWRDDAFLEHFGGRREMIAYCQARNLPITATQDKPYSTDANLLGLTHEAGRLEYLDVGADFIEPGMGVFPKDAPDRPETFSVTLEAGRPVLVNGEPVDAVSAIATANDVGGRHGVGIGIHTVENRFVGIKSRRGVRKSGARTAWRVLPVSAAAGAGPQGAAILRFAFLGTCRADLSGILFRPVVADDSRRSVTRSEAGRGFGDCFGLQGFGNVSILGSRGPIRCIRPNCLRWKRSVTTTIGIRRDF